MKVASIFLLSFVIVVLSSIVYAASSEGQGGDPSDGGGSDGSPSETPAAQIESAMENPSPAAEVETAELTTPANMNVNGVDVDVGVGAASAAEEASETAPDPNAEAPTAEEEQAGNWDEDDYGFLDDEEESPEAEPPEGEPEGPGGEDVAPEISIPEIVPPNFAHVNSEGELTAGEVSVPQIELYSVINLELPEAGEVIVDGNVFIAEPAINTHILFESVHTMIINPGMPNEYVLHYLGESEFIVNHEGTVEYAEITSLINQNNFVIEGYNVTLNADDVLMLILLENGNYNISIHSDFGNITDPFLQTECIVLGKTSRYIYSGLANDKFSFYIPSFGADYSLCLRTLPMQNFQRSCSSCGYIDFLNSNMSLSGIFDYELPSLLVPASGSAFLSEKAIQSKVSGSTVVKETNRTVLFNSNPANVMKSITSSANFMFFEYKTYTCAAQSPYEKNHFAHYYRGDPKVEITEDYIYQKGIFSEFNMTKEGSAAQAALIEKHFKRFEGMI